MADESFSGLNEKSIKNAQKIKSEVGEIKGAIDDLNKSLQLEAETLNAIQKSFSGITNAADAINNNNIKITEALAQQKNQLNFVKDLTTQISKLRGQVAAADDKTRLSLKEQIQNITELKSQAKQLADVFGDIAKSTAELNSSTVFFSKLAEATKSVPILKQSFEAAAKASKEAFIKNAESSNINKSLSKLSKEELESGKGLTKEKLKQLGLSEAAKNQSGAAAASALRNFQATNKQSNVFMTGLNAGFKTIGQGVSSFFKGGGWIGALITGAIELFKFIKDAMFAADNRITNIAKSLSISKENAAGVYKNLTNLKGSLDTIYATTENIVEAFNQVSTATKFIGVATNDQIETQIILTKNLGLQVEEAQQLQGLFAANNIESSKGVDIVYDQVAAFANENKLLANGAKTLKEIQNTSKLILVNFRGNVGELTKTILEAQKLGLSLDQVNKVAGSLLNFEESISAELEAELLLGKDINLERARLFALNNDIAGVTKEIANQGITIESFSRMNRIQQEAIAKTLGMQAEELGKALYDAKVIEKLGGRDLEQKREAAKRQREIAEASGDAKKIAAAMNAEARVASIEKQILTGKDIQNAEKSVTIQEKFNNLLERAKEIFSDVFTGEMLDKFANGLERFIKAIESGRSLASIFLFGLDETLEERLANRTKQRQIMADKEGKSLAEIEAREDKLLLEKYSDPRFNQGLNLNKAGGIGRMGMAEGGIVTQPTNALIGEAGQDEAVVPLNEFYAKIDQLIQVQQNTILAIKEGKDIYLDYNKISVAQNIVATKTS